jgi:NitT/TauT family transport system substrate-binding protein
VNKRYLVSHQDTVKKLLASLIEVTQRINADKPAAVVILNEQLKKETGKTLKPEVIQRAMERVEFTWDPICASLKKSAASAHAVGFFKKPAALDGIYSLSLLNEVLKEKNLPLVEGLAP